MMYDAAALVALIFILSVADADANLPISPRDAYCDIHENHTLCIYQGLNIG
jgi:hypothetical protein